MPPIKFLFALSIFCTGAIKPVVASEPQFDIRLLAVDANEGIAAGDIDGDGKKDLVAGRYWFSGGDWAARPLRHIEDWNGYVQSNGDYLMDVDKDGRLDVIAGDFIDTKIHWYQNPGAEALRLGKVWPKFLLVDTGTSTNEGQLMHDIDGDGKPEWIVNSWKNDVPMLIWRFEEIDQADEKNPARYKLKRHVLGETANGHGLGIGDISGDGRLDVLVGQGWYEQPAEGAWSGPWEFHKDWLLHSSLPMIVVDLDQDKDNDVIFGNGHDFGLQWWENTGRDESDKLTWKEHLIDRGWSQPHSMIWADINNDGQPDLITGKRYYAHNGGDPGGQDPPRLMWYRWDASTKSFKGHLIDEGHVGTGLQIVAEDLNGDGATDVAVAGKSGTYVLLAQP